MMHTRGTEKKTAIKVQPGQTLSYQKYIERINKTLSSV